ncbi:hypothetical protein ACKWTF_014338 [Chironomus riparius]
MKSITKRKFCKFLSRISTIHGLNYISDRKTSKKSKIFWISAFILSFLGCFFFFLQVYEKVFVVPDMSAKITYEPFVLHPFPAITICPYNKLPYKSSNIADLLEKLDSSELTADEELQLEVSSQTCHKMTYNSENIVSNFSEINIVDYLSKIQFNKSEIISKFILGDHINLTDPFLTRVFTFNGFCITFNQLDFDEIFTNEIHDDFKVYSHARKSNWTLANGYTYPDEPGLYPIQMSFSSSNTFNAILIQNKINIDEQCRPFRRGFEIYFHLPNEILTPFAPSINLNNINKDNLIQFKAESFEMSSDMKTYSVEARQCYFYAERNLQFFKSYTENNCQIECLSNKTLEQCGCAKYHMPRGKDTRICMGNDSVCVLKVDADHDAKIDYYSCDCYPPCTDLKYELFSWTDADLDDGFSLGDHFTLDDLINVSDRKITTLITIKNAITPLLLRTSFSAYQMQQFISDFGGLLSLAMGCSILSIVELIYNAFNIKNEPDDEDDDEENLKNCKTN